MKNTRKILERIPDGNFEYKPHPKSMSLGRLASHVANIPSWVNFVLEQEMLDLAPDAKPFYAESRDGLLEAFDKGVVTARENITAASDEHWAKTWTFKYGGKEIMSMPRTAVMRLTVMNHLIHHRAQLGVVLRLNDVKIPGMYGPSADDGPF